MGESARPTATWESLHAQLDDISSEVMRLQAELAESRGEAAELREERDAERKRRVRAEGLAHDYRVARDQADIDKAAARERLGVAEAALAMAVEVLDGVEKQDALDMRPHGVITEALHAGRLALDKIRTGSTQPAPSPGSAPTTEKDAGSQPSQHLPADLKEEFLRARAGLAEAAGAFEAIVESGRRGSAVHGIACIGLQTIRRRLDRALSVLREGQKRMEPFSDSPLGGTR